MYRQPRGRRGGEHAALRPQTRDRGPALAQRQADTPGDLSNIANPPPCIQSASYDELPLSSLPSNCLFLFAASSGPPAQNNARLGGGHDGVVTVMHSGATPLLRGFSRKIFFVKKYLITSLVFKLPNGSYIKMG